jgi:hypothetical protein
MTGQGGEWDASLGTPRALTRDPGPYRDRPRGVHVPW